MSFFGEWSFREDLQISLIVLASLIEFPEFLQRLSQSQRGNRVPGFVDQRLAVTRFCGVVILAPQIKIAYLDVFDRPVRIPGVEFLYVSRCSTLLVLNLRLAEGMLGRIVFGWTDIHPSIFAAGSLTSRKMRIRSGFIIIGPRRSLVLRDTLILAGIFRTRWLVLRRKAGARTQHHSKNSNPMLVFYRESPPNKASVGSRRRTM